MRGSHPLSVNPAFESIREPLLTKDPRWLVCETCEQEYDPAHHTLHKQQLCPGRPAATTPRSA